MMSDYYVYVFVSLVYCFLVVLIGELILLKFDSCLFILLVMIFKCKSFFKNFIGKLRCYCKIICVLVKEY